MKKILVYSWLSICLILLSLNQINAVPPLVSGDVPTAEKNQVEWFIGTRYQRNGKIERQLPFTELVYGISNRQEVTFEIPYLSVNESQGFGDVVIGTKYQFILETDAIPGIAGSFEVKLANGTQENDLGTGAMEYELRLRSQKTWEWFTGILNFGYTFVGEPEKNGIKQERDNVLFTAFAQEYQITPRTNLLSEIYWKTGDDPEVPYRLAADIGFMHRLFQQLFVHATIGKSIRQANRGGPDFRAYSGMKLEFGLPKIKS